MHHDILGILLVSYFLNTTVVLVLLPCIQESIAIRIPRVSAYCSPLRIAIINNPTIDPRGMLSFPHIKLSGELRANSFKNYAFSVNLGSGLVFVAQYVLRRAPLFDSTTDMGTLRGYGIGSFSQFIGCVCC